MVAAIGGGLGKGGRGEGRKDKCGGLEKIFKYGKARRGRQRFRGKRLDGL